MKTSATSQDYYHYAIDALVNPASALFGRPIDVVNDIDLTVNEKRAILASWASDACAVEATPALRRIPGNKAAVLIDEILSALHSLDAQAQGNMAYGPPPAPG